MKKVVSRVIMGISILIFLLAIYIMIFGTIAIKQNKLLNIFGYSYGLVPTDSMEGSKPEGATLDGFKKGSVVLVKIIPYEELELYDIVVFNYNGMLTVHRIIEKNNDTFITRGDNSPLDQTEILTSLNYEGKVFKSFNFFNIGTWANDARVIILGIFILILIIYIIFQIYKLVKTLNEEKINKENEISDEEIKRLVDERLKVEENKDEETNN